MTYVFWGAAADIADSTRSLIPGTTHVINKAPLWQAHGFSLTKPTLEQKRQVQRAWLVLAPSVHGQHTSHGRRAGPSRAQAGASDETD